MSVMRLLHATLACASAALPQAYPLTAPSSDPALDDAHPMGFKHVRTDTIRSAPPSNRRNFIASVDGEITRPGREGFYLPPLRADDPTCRDLWADQAHAGN